MRGEEKIIWTSEDDKIFDEYYKAIIKSKSKFLKDEIKKLEHILKVTVTPLGIHAEIDFFKEKLDELNRIVFEGPDASRVIDKLTKKRYKAQELIHDSQIRHLRKSYLIPELKEMHIGSTAGKYLSPHLRDYYVLRLNELKALERNKAINTSEIRQEAINNNLKERKYNNEKFKSEKTTFIWTDDGGKALINQKNERITYLHHFLTKYNYISKIPLQTFKFHFTGTTHKAFINWLKPQNQLIVLLNGLRPFLNKEFYSDKNPSMTVIIKHFLCNGKKINRNNLDNTASRLHAEIKKEYKHINMLINTLSKILPRS